MYAVKYFEFLNVLHDWTALSSKGDLVLQACHIIMLSKLKVFESSMNSQGEKYKKVLIFFAYSIREKNKDYNKPSCSG